MHCKYLPLSPYKPLEKFSKALYGTKGGTYSARIFRPVMSGREKLGLECIEGISGRKWLRENIVGQFAQNMTEVLEIVRHNSGFENVLLHCSLTGISMEYLRLRVFMNYHFFFVFLSMYDGDKRLNVITILSPFLRNLTLNLRKVQRK